MSHSVWKVGKDTKVVIVVAGKRGGNMLADAAAPSWRRLRSSDFLCELADPQGAFTMT